MSRASAARGRVREVGGSELLERLEHVDASRRESGTHPARQPLPAPAAGDAVDCDVVIAGGGLWSLLAPLLAARGLRVTVLERARAAGRRRAWNASGAELNALVGCGLFDRRFLDLLVVTSYEHGVCRFAGGGEYAVSGVLDHAVDSTLLLASARAAAEESGAKFLDAHDVRAHASGSGGVRVTAACGRAELAITGRVLVDARGAASPYAGADLVCPMAGGVVTGLVEGSARDEVNPRVGEILTTIDGVSHGRQHVWEAFPGWPGETTVHLFHYAHATETVSLVDLYARFLDALPRFKRGDARVLHPTFGYAPAWSRLRRAARPSPPHPGSAVRTSERVVLVGHAAGRRSPLTDSGFGAMLRSLAPAAAEIEHLAAGGPSLPRAEDSAAPPMAGALAQMLASRAFRGGELNEILDASFKSLHAMGNRAYGDLLRDEMTPEDFTALLRRTARANPGAWRTALRAVPPRLAAQWEQSFARTPPPA